MNVLLFAAVFAAWPTLPPLPEPGGWPKLPDQVAVVSPKAVELPKAEPVKKDQTPDVQLVYIGASWCSSCPGAKREAEKLQGRKVRYFDVDQDRDERWVQYCLANLGGAMPRFILLVDDQPWRTFGGQRDVAYLRKWLLEADNQWRTKNGVEPVPSQTTMQTYRTFEIETPTARSPPRRRVTYGCGNPACVMCYGR